MNGLYINKLNIVSNQILNLIVINNTNYADYFNQTDGGKLVDSTMHQPEIP